MIANKGDVCTSWPASCIRCELVGNKLVTDRAALSVRKRLDMDEYLRSTSAGRNKSEALVVLPVGDLALISHGRSHGGLAIVHTEAVHKIPAANSPVKPILNPWLTLSLTRMSEISASLRRPQPVVLCFCGPLERKLCVRSSPSSIVPLLQAKKPKKLCKVYTLSGRKGKSCPIREILSEK